mgnify:FL=1|tara:strand:- start:98 stop:250 length:153 start_codon:yes stop_codon:yes gene_type:complete
MNKQIFKSKKFIKMVIVLAITLITAAGYNISPRFADALVGVTCEIVECTE